jgi:hypothetical protein
LSTMRPSQVSALRPRTQRATEYGRMGPQHCVEAQPDRSPEGTDHEYLHQDGRYRTLRAAAGTG